MAKQIPTCVLMGPITGAVMYPMRSLAMLSSTASRLFGQVVPEDEGDSVCDICKEMIQEARDQLMSNETQEELKEVFEGSCKLIPIKLISMECIKVN